MQPFAQATYEQLNRILKIVDDENITDRNAGDNSIINWDWFIGWIDGASYPLNEQTTDHTIRYWEKIIEGRKND